MAKPPFDFRKSAQATFHAVSGIELSVATPQYAKRYGVGFIMSLKNWRKLTPFYFYTAVVVLLLTATSGHTESSKSGILLLIVSGFLSWGLVEYVMHRFVFHLETVPLLGGKFANTSHLAHHENPRDKKDLFANLSMSLPIATVYWLLAWAALGSWLRASYLLTGLVTGYFCYEWLHFQAHHGRSRLPILRYLKKYHLLHHYRTPDRRFGVTSPFFDLLFGTFSLRK
jgi:sterol desaturase/sphingolipid hydroxylase (fatty acid hydroxylase superfamily)